MNNDEPSIMLAVPCETCNGMGTVSAGEEYHDKNNVYNTGSTGSIVRTCPRCFGTLIMSSPVRVSELFALMKITPKGTRLDEMFHQDEPDVQWNQNQLGD